MGWPAPSVAISQPCMLFLLQAQTLPRARQSLFHKAMPCPTTYPASMQLFSLSPARAQLLAAPAPQTPSPALTIVRPKQLLPQVLCARCARHRLCAVASPIQTLVLLGPPHLGGAPCHALFRSTMVSLPRACLVLVPVPQATR